MYVYSNKKSTEDREEQRRGLRRLDIVIKIYESLIHFYSNKNMSHSYVFLLPYYREEQRRGIV